MGHRTDQEQHQPSPTDHAVAIAYDNHGSRWGTNSVENAETLIANERQAGASIDEWDTTDRDGQPLRVVRIPDADWLDTIFVFTAEDATAVTA
ncbi:hypothetical protein [Streptomyces sp. M92]|uniref:hypothetical protein n=1 Tax=Streptomyces sp. M92 TaxID=2944250 RepID=UPI00234A8D27|nr:hypothetical protein [Streptomyces sp. M92]WCN06042.1 hypothetical protein M6G08_30365 [Streptomyces sp. M92]